MVRWKSVKPKKVKVIEKIEPKELCCKNCKYAYLMRSEKWNPIVAECPNNKERHVASTPQNEKCGFEKREGEIVIHKMIYLK